MLLRRQGIEWPDIMKLENESEFETLAKLLRAETDCGMTKPCSYYQICTGTRIGVSSRWKMPMIQASETCDSEIVYSQYNH